MPIRLRLTLWFSVLLALSLLALSVAVYLLMSHELLSNLDGSLTDQIHQANASISVNDTRVSVPHADDLTDGPIVPEVVVSRNHKVIAGALPDTLDDWLAGQNLGLGHSRIQSVADFRVGLAPIWENGTVYGAVVVWESLKPVNVAERTLLLILIAAGFGSLFIAALGGLFLSRRALAPVSGLTRAAAALSVSNLEQRVPVGPHRDEITELARTFNGMLSRLHESVTRQRLFTASASHQLRSPLAVIRAESSLALERPRPAEEYQQALTIIDEQAASLEKLIEALLAFARAERAVTHAEPVAIGDFVASAVRQCSLLAGARRVTLEQSVEPDLIAGGDGALLGQALTNLLDNGVRASPEGDHVTIEARRENGLVVISVRDRGAGIAAEGLDRLFEPFYQTDTAKTPGADTHGLGLAICRQIVRAHGGEVKVVSAVGEGSCFSIILPRGERVTVPERTT